MTQLVPTTQAHVEALGRAMRAADAAECVALGLVPAEAPLASWRASAWAATLLVGGEVAAVGGLTPADAKGGPLGPRWAQVWLLTTPAVEAAPMALCRAAKAALRASVGHADGVWQLVDARYEVSLRWLHWLGFRIGGARPQGPAGALFHFCTWEAPWAP